MQKFHKSLLVVKKIINGEYTQNELLSLNDDYQSTIDEIGKSIDLVYLMKDYAKLKAYHMYETKTAAQILEECIDLLPESELQAECKLMLGDIYLINNKEWDAIIQYSQVEKALEKIPSVTKPNSDEQELPIFKVNSIGHRRNSMS